MSTDDIKYQNFPVIMPEYGRHIQDMVLHCLSIIDVEERRQCARQIVKTMLNVAPEKSSPEVNNAKGVMDNIDDMEVFLDETNVYWDHLAIISEFRLIDICPKGTITLEEYQRNKQSIKQDYPSSSIRYRYYGKIIEEAIKKVCEMPKDSPERKELEQVIALQMKRSYMTWNNVHVTDVKIFTDLFELSEEQIILTPETNPKLVVNPNSIVAENKSNKNRSAKKSNKRR